MKKRVVVIACVVLALLLVVAHFIPTYNQKTVIILAPILHPAQMLNSPAEWQRWNPVMQKYCIENAKACPANDNSRQSSFTVNAGQHSFAIAAHGASYDVTETNKGNTVLYNYTLVPSASNDTTSLIVTENTNLLALLFSTGNANAWKYADSLKSFVENPSAFYGFPMTFSPVIDTLILTTHRVVLNKNPALALAGLYKKLDDFMQTNHLTAVHPKIARFEPKGSDSITVSVGVPVDKRMPLNATQKDITFLRMLPQARMVIGHYKGIFSGRGKVYHAIYKYLNESRLRQEAGTEYEEYMNNVIPENDNSIVEINICVPHL